MSVVDALPELKRRAKGKPIKFEDFRELIRKFNENEQRKQDASKPIAEREQD